MIINSNKKSNKKETQQSEKSKAINLMIINKKLANDMIIINHEN